MAMRNIRCSAETVRCVWTDPEMTLRQAAAASGMSQDALRARASALELPPRRSGRREAIRPHHEAEFRRMWLAGVSSYRIGTVFGASYCAVRNAALRLGLPMRGAGFRPVVTLEQFADQDLQSRLAESAAASNRAVRWWWG